MPSIGASVALVLGAPSSLQLCPSLVRSEQAAPATAPAVATWHTTSSLGPRSLSMPSPPPLPSHESAPACHGPRFSFSSQTACTANRGRCNCNGSVLCRCRRRWHDSMWHAPVYARSCSAISVVGCISYAVLCLPQGAPMGIPRARRQRRQVANCPPRGCLHRVIRLLGFRVCADAPLAGGSGGSECW